MILYNLDRRPATVLRLAGLGLIVWSLLSAGHRPASSGRGLLIGALLAATTIAWLVWVLRPGREQGLTPELYVLTICGAFLLGASPDSAASAFVFVAVIAAGLRAELARALAPVALGTLALAVATLVYRGGAVGLLAYALGFAAALLAASNIRQSIARAEEAELLLAQTQRSHEEQLRAARLQESARIARDIHDVLAHALAGLVLQLEATASLIERGADRAELLERVRRSHELAREGLRETRRAVGALRGEPIEAPATIEALVAEHRAIGGGSARLSVDGDAARLSGPVGEAVVRVAQEALTNARKHAPGSDVSVVVHAGERRGDEVVLLVRDRPAGAAARAVSGPARPAHGLRCSGGGFGLRGMRERAELLGGTLGAGATDEGGWQVELRLPPAAAAGTAGAPAAGQAPERAALARRTP